MHKNRSFMRRVAFALAGFSHAVRTERSLRTQLAMLAVVVGGLLYLRPAPVWWALVSVGAACVLAAELFNTAVEHLADHVHPQLHPQIRIVKDCAAAAVLCTARAAAGIGIALLVEVAGHWR